MVKPTFVIIWEYAKAILSAGVFALIIITFVVQAFRIPSGSMLETLQIGDFLLVNKFIYGIKNPFTDETLISVSDPERGDIVVFRNPKDTSIDFIKRIVGIPGDRLEMRNRVLYLNGQPVKEPYVRIAQPPSAPRDNFPEIIVPEGKYFMMGDNRDESYDSRFWGFVDRKLIRGKAWRIYWSWESLTNIRWSRLGTLIQ